MIKRLTTQESATKPPLVLVVDDFADNRAMYAEYLQYQGFRVAQAVNGEDAVARTRDLLPSIVVMDLSLPVMDGWEATRRIKADEHTKHIRVIALTGHAELSHANRALEVGCDDFVAKPCLPDELLGKIREHLQSEPAGEPGSASPRGGAWRRIVRARERPRDSEVRIQGEVHRPGERPGSATRSQERRATPSSTGRK